MKIAVITNDVLKEEWLAQGIGDAVEMEWLPEPIAVENADGYIDLLFQPAAERINKLKKLSAGSGGQPAIILVNSVMETLNHLPEKFIRINGWPTFLKRPVVESSCNDEDLKKQAENIFSFFNKTAEWVSDVPGFITPRIISMIINEAYFTLDEKVSSKKEIDIALKLGTNYPYGPFEWSEKIGLKNIFELLSLLAITQPRYEPSALLKKEALTL